MKLAILAAGSLLFALTASAQLQPRFAHLRTQPTMNWYTSAKTSFSTLQRSSAPSVVLRKTQTNGFQELVAGLNDGEPVERVKSTRSTPQQGGRVVCNAVTKEIDLSIRPEFNILKTSSQTQIFPGVITTAAAIMGESVTTPPNLPARKPMTLNINLPGAPVASKTLASPGTVDQQFLNSFVRDNANTPIPAMIGLSLTEVDSKFEFASALETSSGIFLPLEEFGIPAEVNAGTAFSGNLDGSNKRKTYLLKFIQPMYILSHNEANPASIFSDAGAGAGLNNLVMINSVTYGRMVFIRIVSEENAGTVRSAVKAKLGIDLTAMNIKAGNSIEGNANLTFSSVVKEFKAVVIGGTTASASRVISDPNQLATYIRDPAAATLTANSGAMPISFTMVRVSDYVSLGIRTVGTFEAIQECRPVTGYSVYIKNFSPSKVVDNPVTGNTEDLFGTISVRAYYRKDGRDIEITDEAGRPAQVWNKTIDNPVQLKEGESVKLYEVNGPTKDGKRRFVFTPEQEATGYIVVTFRLGDKIMKDGEDLGNRNPSVAYEEKVFRYELRDWTDMRDEAGCTMELKEVGGDAKICVNFSKYRD